MKRRYQKNIIQSFCKYANRKKKIKPGVADLKCEDGSYTENDLEKANVLNSFFQDVFVSEDKNNIPSMNNRIGGNTLSEADIYGQMGNKMLGNFNINKSPGPDSLPPRVLKELRFSVGKPLTLIYRDYMASGTLPNEWKTDIVKTLFKNRPISLTCISCKMLERIVRENIVIYMNEHKLFSKSQYGFGSLRSCNLQLLEVMENG